VKGINLKWNEKVLSWLPGRDTVGMMIWPFILYKGTPSEGVRLHEWCHWRHAFRWFVIPWYIAYGVLLLIHRTSGPDHPFEGPAYSAASEVEPGESVEPAVGD
jgi:hypothetical protein